MVEGAAETEEGVGEFGEGGRSAFSAGGEGAVEFVGKSANEYNIADAKAEGHCICLRAKTRWDEL